MLPRQTRHELHGDTARFECLGLIHRNDGRGIEKRLERSRQACRLTGRQIPGQQSEPNGLGCPISNLEFEWLGHRAPEVSQDLRHAHADLGVRWHGRQEGL